MPNGKLCQKSDLILDGNNIYQAGWLYLDEFTNDLDILQSVRSTAFILGALSTDILLP